MCADLNRNELNWTPNFDILNFGWLHICEIWCLGHVTFFLHGFYVEVNQIWRDFVFAVSNSRSRCQFAPRWVRFWSRNHFSDFLRTQTSVAVRWSQIPCFLFQIRLVVTLEPFSDLKSRSQKSESNIHRHLRNLSQQKAFQLLKRSRENSVTNPIGTIWVMGRIMGT